jgi:5'-deoxynucleotidase YfbR-like HD superfamily hydrolase
MKNNDPKGGDAYKGKTSICTFSGIQFHPLDPEPHLVNPNDIAHSLAYQCRYAGHSKFFYSIAEHSVLVADYVNRRWPGHRDLVASALLHDASEAYLTDLGGPIKRDPRVLEWWNPVEEKLERVISEAFGVPFPIPDEVYEADRQILRLEIEHLMPKVNWWTPVPPDEWAQFLDIEGWYPDLAEEKFKKYLKQAL